MRKHNEDEKAANHETGVRGRLADSEDPEEIETSPLSGKTAKPD
jgi:hypothetical protein